MIGFVVRVLPLSADLEKDAAGSVEVSLEEGKRKQHPKNVSAASAKKRLSPLIFNLFFPERDIYLEDQRYPSLYHKRRRTLETIGIGCTCGKIRENT